MPWILLLILIFLVVTDSEKTSRIDLLESIYSRFESFIDRAALATGIPISRIIAMIATESSGKENLPTGPAGEEGLLQVTPGALSDVNRKFGWTYSSSDLRSADVGVMVGTEYLSILQSEFNGDLDLATRAFNGGAGNVRKDPSYDTAYLERVKSFENLLPNSLT